MSAWVCSACGQRYDHAGYCAFDGQPLVATDDPLLGTEVGRYRMARLIGEGGMGRVYLAIQPAIGSRVAIKILSDQCARSPELLDRFFAEARAVNLIHHESIVSVIDMAQLPDGRPFIVMEYVEGKTLAAVVRGGPVPLGGLVQVMSEVLSALTAAHAIGIVHRDLKPDNILITAEGHAKVLDFGIAKLAPELHQQLSPRTRTGALLGTPQYMAPEQISGSGNVDPRTDLYAAGIVVYELATGRLPFTGETLFDLMRAHLEQPPPPPRTLRRDLPPALEQAILTALAKKPDDRFHSAAEMSQALHQAASALPPDQWRSLSARSLGGSGSGPRSDSQIPLAYRQTRPVGPAPTLDGSGRVGLIIGAVVVSALAVGSTLFAVAHRGGGESAAVAQAPGGPAGPGAPATTAALAKPTTPNTTGAPDTTAASGTTGAPDTTAASGTTGAPATTAALAKPTTPNTTGAPATPATLATTATPDTTTTTDPAAPTGHLDEPAALYKRVHRNGSPTGGPAALTAAGSPTGGPAAPTAAGSPAAPTAAGSPPAATPAPHGQGPTIIGGGSAADHGVFIGPNVTLGSNVIIGSTTPAAPVPLPGAGREELQRPADYNPKHFDPVAYLPKAQQLARELVPDAHLTSFEFDPVFPDGHVDLTLDSRDHAYEFRSAERSVFPAGRPRNMPIDRKCRVSVDIGVHGVSARVLSSDTCNAKLIRAPRCSFAGVWKQALAHSIPSDVVARIAWLSDERWFFDIDLGSQGIQNGVSSFDDRCL